MIFLPSLGLGPGTTSAVALDRVRALGGDIAESEAHPSTRMRAFRVSGTVLDAEAVDGLVVYAVGARVIRVLAHTRVQQWTARFGAPRRESEGYRLWAWTEPRWSVERRPDDDGWVVEAKFLDEAIAAAQLREEYVQKLYATL